MKNKDKGVIMRSDKIKKGVERIPLKFRPQIRFLTQQIKEEYKPDKIILYGSVARNRAKRDSDIDIFIIKQTSKGLLERMNEVFNIVDSRIPIEPIIYTPLEVKKRINMGDSFVKDILEKGILLYEERRNRNIG